MPNQLLVVQRHTIAISGLTLRTELPHLLVIPSLTPHPVHPDGESAGHRDLGDLPSPTHRQVKRLAAWLLKTSICLKTDPKGVTRNVSEIGENRL